MNNATGCAYFTELISAAVDRELSGSEASVLAEHLCSCKSCREVYGAMQALSDSISSDIAPLPDGLHEKIMAPIRRSAIRRKNSRTFRTLTAAACAAIVLLGSFIAADKVQRAAKNTVSAAKAESAAAEAFQSAAPEENTPEAPEALPEEALEAAEDNTAPAEISFDDVQTQEEAEKENKNDALPPMKSKNGAKGDTHADLSEMSWDEVKAFFAGKAAESPAGAPEKEYLIDAVCGEEKVTITVFVIDDSLYIGMPGEKSLMLAGFSEQELNEFINNQ